MKLYCITDNLSVVAKTPAELIQIRAKDLEARPLMQLVLDAIGIAGPGRVLVNGRMDVALAAGAAGVHLPGNSMSPRTLRSLAPSPFLIGVSCHTPGDLRQAEDEGADFAVYGPVFPTGTKPAMGLEAFSLGTRSVTLPVYALGGVTWQNATACIDAGAAGIAGISLFA